MYQCEPCELLQDPLPKDLYFYHLQCWKELLLSESLMLSDRIHFDRMGAGLLHDHGM